MPPANSGDRLQVETHDGPRASEPQRGEILGDRYEVIRRLSAGGMGAVYEARDLVLGRPLAVKILHSEFASRPQLVQRFIREAKLAGGLASQHIVTVFDSGSVEGVPYFVMELLRGHDLRQVLLESPRLAVSRAINLALDVCSGLVVAHDAGLVHRDLKPANIFVTRNIHGRDVAKVLDFGVAKLRDSLDLTGEETLIGTIGYMAPEQVTSGRDVDARADIYSLGVILYEALTGTRMHGGERTEVLYSIVYGEPPALDEQREKLPRGLAAVVARALCRSPGKRYATARQFGAALEPFAGQARQDWAESCSQFTGSATALRPDPDAITRSESHEESSFGGLRSRGRLTRFSSSAVRRLPRGGWIGALVVTPIGLFGVLSALHSWSERSPVTAPAIPAPAAATAPIRVSAPITLQPSLIEPPRGPETPPAANTRASTGGMPRAAPLRAKPAQAREPSVAPVSPRLLSPGAVFDPINPYRVSSDPAAGGRDDAPTPRLPKIETPTRSDRLPPLTQAGPTTGNTAPPQSAMPIPRSLDTASH